MRNASADSPELEQTLGRRELLQRAGGLTAAALLASAELDLARAIAGPQASHHVGKKALRELQRSVSGKVLLRGQSGYSRAHKVFNKRFNGLHPSAVVEAKGVADVQAVMRWAARYDVNIRAKSGGHSYAGYSTTDSGVVVDLGNFRRVRTTNNNQRAEVGAGVELIRMYSKLAKQGVSVPGGSCPTVGIAGLAMGGGMGFASRRHGLTCDAIRAVEIVTPDGRLRRVTKQQDPDLFWACRGGGGGNFGIVTGFEFKTFAAKRAAWYFASWPYSQAGEVLEAWQKLTEEATDDLCPFFSLLTGRGEPKVHSEGQYFGSVGEMEKALRPLTDVAGTSLETGTLPYGALMKRWAGCESESLSSCEKPNRTVFYAGSDYVGRRLDSSGRKRMLEAIEKRQGADGSGAILCDGYGGAINRPGKGATAFVHRDQVFCIQYYAEPGSRSDRKPASRWISSARGLLADHTSGQAYQNYIDPKLKGWERAYYGSNLERLRAVQATYDPDGRLAFRQGIPPKS